MLNLGNWRPHLSKDAIAIAEHLAARAQSERDSGKTIYPAQGNIFRALELTSPESVKVVIVGQDPYHGPRQANGLCFSVGKDVQLPPSLVNIYKELESDIGRYPADGDLSGWAKQGVLMLNTVLTVEDGRANSHKDWGWQEFVLDVFGACLELPQPVIFLLWGAQARAFVDELSIDKYEGKMTLCSSHPSPLGAYKGSAVAPAFIGSRPFSRTNTFLQKMGSTPIDW